MDKGNLRSEVVSWGGGLIGIGHGRALAFDIYDNLYYYSDNDQLI